MEATLPVLKNSVDHMNQLELRAFIPQILQLESGNLHKQVYSQDQRPLWWPRDLPFSSMAKLKSNSGKVGDDKHSWTRELRKIVRNCYRYYGQEHLLNGNEPVSECDDSIKVVNNQDGSVSFITDQTVVTLEDRQNTPYASCPSTTEAATPGRSLSACTGMQPMPTGMQPMPTGMQPMPTGMQPMPTGLFRSNTATTTTTTTTRKVEVQKPLVDVQKPFVEVFMCFFCERQFNHRDVLRQHQKFDCALRPVELTQKSVYNTRQSTQSGGYQPTKLYQPVKVIPRRPLKLVEEKVVFPAKGTYIEWLDLLPQAKAERVRRQSQGKKIDCDLIEVDESRPVKTPTTPRTPKSLMSQLSRDASPPGRSRLLSRDVSPPARTRLNIGEDIAEEAKDDGKDVSDDESECSKSDNGEENYRPRRVATLLNIDISSLLGDRVRKHISAYYDANDDDDDDSDSDSNSSPKNSYETYCRTPTKSKDVGRLRSRGSEFQVTFKKSKRTAPKHSHHYKFRRSELSEFCRIVETGLNKRSRRLKRQTKKCKVVLARLSEEMIARWCRPQRQSHLSAQKQADIRHWMSDSSSTSLANFQYLRSLLIHSTPGDLDHRSREHYLYQNMHHGIREAPPRLGNSAADLTPPSTPEEVRTLPGGDDDDIIILEDSSPLRPNMDCSGNQLRTPTQSPQKRQRKTPLTPRSWVDDGDSKLDEDVISISSTESDSELKVISPESLKRAADFSPVQLPTKRRRIEELRPAALLFRCHLCHEEITCHNGANVYIKQHFSRRHAVCNIDLIEHLDASGQKVVSIVEVPTPQKHPTTANLPKPKASSLQAKSFYSGVKPAANGKAKKSTAAATKSKVTAKSSLPGSKNKNQTAKGGNAKSAANKVTSTKVKRPNPNAHNTNGTVAKANRAKTTTTTKTTGKKTSGQVTRRLFPDRTGQKSGSKKTVAAKKSAIKVIPNNKQTSNNKQAQGKAKVKHASSKTTTKPKVSGARRTMAGGKTKGLTVKFTVKSKST